MEKEIWQVEVNGQVYEADFEELTQWIAERALLPSDKVRKGNRNWMLAERVPVLQKYFNNESVSIPAPAVQAEAAVSASPVQIALPQPPAPETVRTETASVTPPTPVAIPPKVTHKAFSRPAGSASSAQSEAAAPYVCHFHPEAEVAFYCKSCGGTFCKGCPKSFGAVRICPLCDYFCEADPTAKEREQAKYGNSGASRKGNAQKSSQAAVQTNVVDDFWTALAYPFKRPLSFFSIAFLNALFSIGVYFGMASLAFGAWFSGLMAIVFFSVTSTALVFGCASRAISQIAHGDIEGNYASSEDFSIGGSILEPAFLGLATFLVSWGPAVAVIVLFVLMLPPVPKVNGETNSLGDTSSEVQTQRSSANPNEISSEDLDALIQGNDPRKQEAAIKKVQQLERNSRSMGLASQESNEDFAQSFVQRLALMIIPFILFFGLAVLWGFFYFPLGLTVAGYTQSFFSTLNPLVGLDTARRMGGTFFKAFLMYIVVIVLSLFVYFFIGIITSPFGTMGINFPAQFIGNFVSFYFYLVISCIFGIALYKSRDKLGIQS